MIPLKIIAVNANKHAAPKNEINISTGTVDGLSQTMYLLTVQIFNIAFCFTSWVIDSPTSSRQVVVRYKSLFLEKRKSF